MKVVGPAAAGLGLQEGRLGHGLLQLRSGAGVGLCQKPRDVSLGPTQGGPGHPTRADHHQQCPEGGEESGREAPDLGGVLADARRRRDHRPEHLRPGLPPAHLPRQQGVHRHLLLQYERQSNSGHKIFKKK